MVLRHSAACVKQNISIINPNEVCSIIAFLERDMLTSMSSVLSGYTSAWSSKLPTNRPMTLCCLQPRGFNSSTIVRLRVLECVLRVFRCHTSISRITIHFYRAPLSPFCDRSSRQASSHSHIASLRIRRHRGKVIKYQTGVHQVYRMTTLTQRPYRQFLQQGNGHVLFWLPVEMLSSLTGVVIAQQLISVPA